MSDTILLTGATGFLGTWVARELLRQTEGEIFVLVRAASEDEAARRLQRAWWDWPELAAAIGGRVRVLRGDVSRPQLGLDEAAYARLVGEVTHIIHCAADLRLTAPLDELRATNVRGTAHVLALARAAHRNHGLTRLAHVSTAYVAGGRSGAVPEDALSDAYGFSSAYELTKYEGERLARAARAELPVSIFRPGMVVGDSASGEITTFNTLYYPLRLYLMERLAVVPARAEARVNLVPVDWVASALVRLTLDPRAAGQTFHLTAPREAQPTVRELVEQTRDWARENLATSLPRPLFVPLPARRGRFRPQDGTRTRHGRWAGLQSLLPYMDDGLEFRRDNVDRLLGAYDLDWRAFLPRLLRYAVDRGFFHRDERTVHEQILFRLTSKSRPVTYHDVIEGEVVARDTSRVRAEMLRAAAALRALGVGPGDRVAIVGLNSTRYLALDVAIGLVGAISVPLYYTAPAAEIDHILASSGARLLLVGAPKVLPRLAELRTAVPTVSFCREDSFDGPRPGVMGWEPFLSLGDAAMQDPAVAASAPVGLGDLATLRYTSGTTGRPKGVMYRHEQVRWMGQSLVSLLPWRARTRRARYLSFLPMNHVVEGILATYAPYYVPAPVDIFFLEDFRQLASALPRVRPTLFFSVPRLYERVWEGVQANPLGRLYLGLREGLAKRLLRPALRWLSLHKAGLDRCAQLMVGSAHASEAMLRGLQELGIEVHNAYGLTEAPLVTLNRWGANRIDTVGAPLPRTEVRIASDGEIMVRGPQVMAGYYGSENGQAAPLREGWLLTGDLGRCTADGRLVIEGRKKELLKTSYGKYIQPAKVEALLRDIPGVAEAMVVGEQRPYCAAILWVPNEALAPGEAQDPSLLRAIDEGIAQANKALAHPEQVKRWAVLPNDLSIERGDLTANLKLKRQAVALRLGEVIDALYDAPSAAVAGSADSSAEREAPAATIWCLGQAQREEAA